MGCSLPQFCSDPPHATFALRQAESALRFHALALILIVLSLVSGFTLLRQPQSWAGKTDPMRLALIIQLFCLAAKAELQQAFYQLPDDMLLHIRVNLSVHFRTRADISRIMG